MPPKEIPFERCSECGMPREFGHGPNCSKRRPEVLIEKKMAEGMLKQLYTEVREIASDKSRFIDKGGAGAVFTLSTGDCVKILFDLFEKSTVRQHMDLSNPVEKEAKILAWLNDIVIDGVRAPRFIGCLKGKESGEPKAIIMERLHATNLQEILSGRQPAPAKFSPESFGGALIGYLNHLHETLGIIHGDLAARNVMVDNETGLPILIDFGRSKAREDFRPALYQRQVERDLEFFDTIQAGLDAFAPQPLDNN